MKNLIIAILLFGFINVFSQDSTITQAFKDNRPPRYYPLIKPTGASYPLMAGYILNKYAKEGDPIAQHELGLRYLLGKGFPQDTIRAIYWIRRAVDKQLTSAMYNYSVILDNGIGVDWNPFEAFKHVQYAAESGMPEAQFFYGIFYTDNLVVNRDYNKAYEWFKKSAEKEYQPAIEAVKNMEERGLVVNTAIDGNKKRNDNETDTMRSSSSALFNPDYELDFFEFDYNNEEMTSTKLSELYSREYKELKTSLGINQDISENQLKDTSAQSIVFFAAERGSPEGLLIVAKDYEYGVSKKKSLVNAVESYIKAYRLGAIKAFQAILKYSREENFYKTLKEEADKGNPSAMYVWAGLTALGFDYQLTNDQALDLLEKAAKLNHVYSLVEKGLCYYTGTLVKEDKNKAYEYWEKAAKLGSIEAEVRLALSKLLEKNSSQLEIQSINVLHKYSEEGSVLAQAALAYCYENGIGIKIDKAKAAKLYRSASHRGSEVAYNSLKRMYDDVRPDDNNFIIYDGR